MLILSYTPGKPLVVKWRFGIINEEDNSLLDRRWNTECTVLMASLQTLSITRYLRKKVNMSYEEVSIWKSLEMEYSIHMQINSSSITLMAKIVISRSSTISFLWKKEEEEWSLVVLSNHLYLVWLKRNIRLNQVARMIGIEWYLNERMRRRIEKRWQC